MRQRIVTMSLAFAIWASGNAPGLQTPAQHDTTRAGPCFRVHGRLGSSNGVGYKIWPVGTKRYLGLTEVPKWLADTIDQRHVMIFADFVVCPLTRARPGVMQIVTIDTATHLVTRHDDFFGPSR
jgi:hypothetical protein